MKKTISLLVLLALFTMFGCFFLGVQNRTVQLQLDENAIPVLFLKADGTTEKLEIWFDRREEIYYFFLPSFVSDNRIFCDSLTEQNVTLDGKVLSRWSSFQWEQEKVYTIGCNGQNYEVVFMKSSNLPALFIETESGDMEYLDADKENEETGKISLIKQTKNVEYHGALKRISARGNSTFDNKDKKAYSFTLNDAYPLCGLDAGKKWNLLAMYFEYDKIHTKLVCDMAEYLGMEYNVDCTWIDLYCNGEYKGLYLLTETVNVGEGRVEIRDLDKESASNTDISGGYLIEKDVEEHLEEEGNWFITEKLNYPFVIKSPEEASEEEIEYIKTYVQNIENLLLAGDGQYKKYIDMDSFAKQFLIDKIVLEPDAMTMSTFFYKEAGSDILKAGPLWDYDRAFGGTMPNYNVAIGDSPNGMSDWYMQLYADEEFREKMISYYKELLPFWDEMLREGIDEYAEHIADSVRMDAKVWPNERYQTEATSYLKHENYIKYLKYFLAKRFNYLNTLWGIPEYQFEVPASTGEEHRVEFVMDNGSVLETRNIPDGSCVETVPELEEEKYFGWGFYEGGKMYSSVIPVYEDIVFYAKRRFNSAEEKIANKLEVLNAAKDLLTYMKWLKDDDFSVCIYINKNSGILEQEDVITALKEICDYEHPEWLEPGADHNKDYFLLVDNGWEQIWSSVNGEELSGINTTFGLLNYGSPAEEDRYLYIREDMTNYLSEGAKEDITFVVIDRYSGSIVNVAIFDDGEWVNRK